MITNVNTSTPTSTSTKTAVLHRQRNIQRVYITHLGKIIYRSSADHPHRQWFCIDNKTFNASTLHTSGRSSTDHLQIICTSFPLDDPDLSGQMDRYI